MANPQCRYCQGTGKVAGLGAEAGERPRKIVVRCSCTRGISPGPDSNPFTRAREGA
jgi:hypothetical protein